MLNVTKELTALARKLGYTGTAPDTVAKAINAITASVGEGGGEGGEDIFYITATWPDDADGYVLDKTVEQIEAAYVNGQLCLIVGEINTRVYIEDGPLGPTVVIDSIIDIDPSGNKLILTQFQLDPETEIVTDSVFSYTLTPVS